MQADSTITEQDMDGASRDFIQGFRDLGDSEPDLAVDGMSDSLLAKLFRLLNLA